MKRGIVPQNIGSGSASFPSTGTTAVSVSGIASGRAASRRSGRLVLEVASVAVVHDRARPPPEAASRSK